MKQIPSKVIFCLLMAVGSASLNQAKGEERVVAMWNQWRGPTRDGQVGGADWPTSLSGDNLKLIWRLELDPSYSGPVVSDAAVFTTGSGANKSEFVCALDRRTGRELWRTRWPGSLQVPFFAAANGSWIRSTPAFDGESLFVAGMCEVLVCLDATSGKERWRKDFVKELGTPLPAFGFVCSPLCDGDALFVQAGAGLVKLNKHTGRIIWRVLQDKGGMSGSAFSSPILATLAGRRQLLVQTREKLVGVDPERGGILWDQPVPSFRGMNILTPVVFGDGVFTSSYQNKSWMFNIERAVNAFQAREAWSNNAQGYMSTPVVVDGHAYIHLQNQRFACIDLRNGTRTWTSKPFGKYSSMVAQNEHILALDQTGKLILLRANPRQFELLDERKISDQETWGHVAISGDEIFVRELNALSVYRWKKANR